MLLPHEEHQQKSSFSSNNNVPRRSGKKTIRTSSNRNIRNKMKKKTTKIRQRGYGISKLEELISEERLKDKVSPSVMTTVADYSFPHKLTEASNSQEACSNNTESTVSSSTSKENINPMGHLSHTCVLPHSNWPTNHHQQHHLQNNSSIDHSRHLPGSWHNQKNSPIMLINTPLSSGVNHQMEMPSAQIHRSTDYIQPSPRHEEERVKNTINNNWLKWLLWRNIKVEMSKRFLRESASSSGTEQVNRRKINIDLNEPPPVDDESSMDGNILSAGHVEQPFPNSFPMAPTAVHKPALRMIVNKPDSFDGSGQATLVDGSGDGPDTTLKL